MSLLAALLSLGCAARSTAEAETAPVREETFICEGKGAPLAGSFYWPSRGTVSLPTAVVAVGAQRWDRYGDLPDKPWGHYRDIAVALAARGAAVVLFDKGGTGATAGPPATFEGRVAELRQILACVRKRPEVGPITYIGHSQGTAVVAAVAQDDPPAALVQLSPAPGTADPPVGVPVTYIQPASESTPSLRPKRIAGVNHLLMPEPATAGVSHVDPEVLRLIGDAVLATRP